MMNRFKEKYLIIFNTFSGGAKLKNADVLIRHFFDWHNIEYQFLFLEKEKSDIEDFDISLLRDQFPYTKILVYGGDGTVRRVVQEVYKYNIDVPIAILPGGSANIYVRYLGLRQSLEKNLEVFLLSRERSMSVGFMNGHIFLLGAFFGTIAQITIEAERNFKDVLGMWAYVIAGLKYSFYFPSRPFTYQLDYEKKEFLEGHSTFVLLSSVAQKYVTFSPEAPEHHFQFFAVSNKDILQFGDVLYRNFIVQEKSKHLHSEKAQNIVIEGDFHESLHLDGDQIDVQEKKFVFEIGKNPVRFLC